MIFTPGSYADFVLFCKTIDAAPKVAYFPHPSGTSYFLYGYLPTSGLLAQFSTGVESAEDFPAFLTDFPGALLLTSTISIESDKFLSFNNLTDYSTYMAAMPAGVAKIVFGIGDGLLEAYAVVGSLVIELMQDIDAEAFLTAFPAAVQLQNRATTSADYGG